jgi:predicted deacylase
VLEVFPAVAGVVRRGQVIARLTDIYGRTVRDYRAPEDGVVVGKSDNPVAHTGARILHLGIVGPATSFGAGTGTANRLRESMHG